MADATRDLLRWLGAHDPPEHILLVCPDVSVPRVNRGTVVVRVADCLAETDVGLVAQLLVNGIDEVAVLACPRGRPHTSAWRETLPVAEHVPPRRGRRPRAVLDVGDLPVPRRVVLGLPVRSVLDLGLDDAARTVAAFRLLEAEGRAMLPTPRPPGEDDQLPGTGEPAALSTAEQGSPPATAADLRVSGCTACGVCVRACPHDALVLEDDPRGSVLTHLHEQCRSEMECVALCPVDAISTAGALPLAVVLHEPSRPLAVVATAACERCGARHPVVEGSLCPTCRFRTANAFGAATPPGQARRLARRQPEPGREQ